MKLRFDRLEHRLAPAAGLLAAFGDLDGDGTLERVTAYGRGGGPIVRVSPVDDPTPNLAFFAYDSAFRGGVTIATADFDGDGRDEIVTGMGPGGTPEVRVFDGQTGQLLRAFLAYEPSFTGGISVATADLDGDGTPDIACGTGTGGGPLVRVFSGADQTVLTEFFAYDSSFRRGINVAAGDADGDGKSEIFTGAAFGGGPHVQIFPLNGPAVASFFAYDSEFRGGVLVAAGDVDGDGLDEVVTAPQRGAAANVRVFDAASGALETAYVAYEPAYLGGVNLTVAQLDAGGAEIIANRADRFESQEVVFAGSEPLPTVPPPPTVPPEPPIPPTPPDIPLSPPAIPPTVPPPPPPPPVSPPPLPGGTFTSDDYVVYRPEGLSPDEQYPLVVTFDPGGSSNLAAYREIWDPIADRQRFVVMYSTYYRNQSPDLQIDDDFYDEVAFAKAKSHIEAVEAAQPIDPTRVILTGHSGGGSFAHALNFVFPGIASVVLANTAMIWGTTEPPEGQNGPLIHETVAANATDYVEEFRAAGVRELVIFLASPGDFRYEEMQNDKNLYTSLGWNVRYQEFSGGHRIAPAQSYIDAIDWLSVQPQWTD